jgi:glycine betaine/choline ABC-type transport system substrate-binding protein
MRFALLALSLPLFLAGCKLSSPPVLTVASRDTTEQRLLGEIIAQHLENRLKIRVERMPASSSAQMSHQYLLSGQADVVPEYTGDALTEILRLPPSTDQAEVRDRLSVEYTHRFQAEWSAPLGLHHGFVLVADASRPEYSSLTSLSQTSERRPGFALAGSRAFLVRADGIGRLQTAYDLRWRTPPRSFDGPALFKALFDRQVDLIAANLTDAALLNPRSRPLQDDRGVLVRYDTAIVALSTSLEKHPGLRQALAQLAGKFSDAQMIRLNAAVETNRRPLPLVAQEFLASAHLP